MSTLRIKLVAMEDINLKPGEEIDAAITIQRDNFAHQEIRRGLVLTAVVSRQGVGRAAAQAIRKLFRVEEQEGLKNNQH